jgi:hypothetical protein
MVPSLKRNFGAMDHVSKEMLDYEFTNKMDFVANNEKVKCFRVVDEEGNIVNKQYEDSIDPQMLKNIFKHMVTINEADSIFLMA